MSLTPIDPSLASGSEQHMAWVPEAYLATALTPFVGAIFCCHERVIMSAIRAIADFSRTALDRR
jgi:hypothetical protein